MKLPNPLRAAIPAALREAMGAQGAFADWLVDARLGKAVMADRALAMAAALRWALNEWSPNAYAEGEARYVIAALEEASNG